MNKIFNTKGQEYCLDKMEFLSGIGSEFDVYKYKDSVIKLYKSDYKFNHLSKSELRHLIKIPTKRILMPSDIVYDENHNVVGYQMPYISGSKDIKNDRVSNVLDEIEVLYSDIPLLNFFRVTLVDIGTENTIYNGKIFCIDSGNFEINNFDRVKSYLDPLNQGLDCYELLKSWNYDKINQLTEMLMFGKDDDIDPYQFRLIIQFIIKQRENTGNITNLPIYREYLQGDLSIADASQKLLHEHTTENPEERELFMR